MEHHNAFESNRVLQALGCLDVGLWDWPDLGATRMHWSSYFYRLIGWQEDIVLADLASLEYLLHPSHRNQWLAALDDLWFMTRTLDVEVMMLTGSGQYRWFRWRGQYVAEDVPTQGGQLIGTLEDVHEKKLAQKGLAEAHEQLNAIFALSEEGFVAIGADGYVHFCSPAVSDLMDLPDSLVLGVSEQDLLTLINGKLGISGDAACLQEWLSAHEECSGSVAQRHRAVMSPMSQPERKLEFRLQRGLGRVTQVLHIRDITKEVEIERVKSEFLSVAAHELRTPMTSIYGFVKLMLHQSFSADRQQNILERVQRQCESMIQIINELLDLARLEAKGAADFDMAAWDIHTLVDEVVQDFKVPDGRESPRWVLGRGGQLVHTDVNKAKQALLNVLSNAYKYSPQGGRVSIEVSQDGSLDEGFYRVTITDQGLGMTPEELKRFGERFFRADRSNGIPGTGLGVSIVQEIMSHMGGGVIVDSTYGQGTSVALRFPIALPI